MKQLHTLLLFGICLAISSLQAQTRYLDPVFDEVEKISNVTYGSNISIITGTPALIDLRMDVYSPIGDVETTNRPVVIYLHTGSFLPQYFNGQVTGSRSDSTVVEICTRLARMGYVAVAATYRQGWQPLAEDQNVRTASLLRAAYRGIQDTRTCVRFLRKSVAENNNPYGIDPDRIVLWGQGTGGYLSLGAAYLDRYDEVFIEKFINTQTAQPYVIESVHGDVYGEMTAQLNQPNHVGYSNEIQMAVNMGGALGDSTWIEGSTPDWPEPPTIGFHVLTDPFAPFGNGPVIVPTTQEFVVDVSGTRTATGRANALGANDPLAPVLTLGDPLTAFVTAVKNVPVDLSALGQAPTTLGTDHIYPFVPPINPMTGGPRLESGPWDWWSLPTLQAVIAAINTQLPPEDALSAQDLHNNGLLTNPNMSAMKARAYIDTVMTYYAPRACFALGLNDCIDALTGVDSVDITINLNMELEDVAASGVFLAGGATFGAPGNFPLTDPDGDGIYSTTIRREVGFSDFYTFTNGNCPDFSCKENIAGQPCARPDNFNDRFLNPVMQDTTISTCFGQCSTDGSCMLNAEANITFQVDMSNETVAASGVFMGGSFEGWGGGIALEDPDGDDIWEVTLELTPGNYEYKFINGENFSDPEIFPAFELDDQCTITTPDGAFTNRRLAVEEGVDQTFCFIYNTCTDCTVGTNDLIVDHGFFRIQPNVVDDVANLFFVQPLAETATVRIYDVHGRYLQQEILGAATSNHQLELNDLPAGVYLLSVRSGNKLGTQRLVVR